MRINLEYNLAMSEVLGRPGWLYNETKALHDEGAILSCSGDSPFQLRLLKGVSSDVSCLSKMCLYVSDPADISNPPVKQTKKDTAEYKKEMEGRGVILPSTVDYATGRRTELIIDINECIPKDSLIFLKSTFNTCPDLLHMVVRSVENDLKLHVDSMLLLKDHAAICRLECNITERNVKPPRFKFEIAEKLCKAVSLSFRDAEVIISDCNRISDYGRSDCPIFEGVYSFETPHVYKADQTTSTTSYNVLISLVDGLETSFTKGVGISVRKLAGSNLFTSYLICFDRENSKTFKSVKISMRFITSQLYVFSVIVRWRHTNWNWIFYSDFLRRVSFCLHFITWQKELKKTTTRQPKTTIRRQCVMVAMMLGTCHPVISIFSFPSTVQLIYVLQSLRHLNLTGSCMEKPTWQRRILKFAVNPFQNLNLTILELKTCLEVCTLSFLEHMVTWKNSSESWEEDHWKWRKCCFQCRHHQQKQAEFFEPSLLHFTKSKLYRRIH